MSDKALRVMASWDWITPVITLIQDWWNRPSVGYNVSDTGVFSAWELKRFLKQKGIKVWGVMVIGDTITLRVRKAQALYTQHWLMTLGMPYQCGIPAGNSVNYRRAKSAAQKQPEGKSTGTIIDAINNLADRLRF
jgi:hypothetical protein